MSAIREPAFRRVAIAWGFSNFGDSALYLMLAVWVKDLTGSAASAGVVFVFLGLPVLLAPFAGQIADRGSRRRAVVLANLVGAIVVASLGLVGGRADLWLIYLVTFIYGSITYLTAAAGAGLVRDLLSDDLLASGNGVLSTIDQGLKLISPLIGVGAYALFGPFAVACIAAVMLVLAAAVMSTVRVVESAPPPREPFWPEVTAGFRHIRGVRVLARVTVALAVAIGVTGLANAVVFAVIDEGLNRGSDFFGVVAAIQGGGAVLGGLTAARLIARMGERGVIAFGMVVMAAGLAAVAIPIALVVCAAAGVVGWTIPLMFVAYSTMRQKATPAHLQGRVQAASNVAFNGPQTIGTAVGAALVAVTDYRVILVGMALVICVCALPAAAGRASALDDASRVTVPNV